jgi:hypothetical protein
MAKLADRGARQVAAHDVEALLRLDQDRVRPRLQRQ